ncbi:MAG: hypothetical protein N2745_05475 [Syntrophorhabdaceae bacterium]|nr:hypothetical protein [Syntrophorhabdaceae bacterium]
MGKKGMFLSAVILGILLSLITPTEEAHFAWERLSFFNIAFGFLGCIVLIGLSKALGKLFIQKREDYYDR